MQWILGKVVVALPHAFGRGCFQRCFRCCCCSFCSGRHLVCGAQKWQAQYCEHVEASPPRHKPKTKDHQRNSSNQRNNKPRLHDCLLARSLAARTCYVLKTIGIKISRNFVMGTSSLELRTSELPQNFLLKLTHCTNCRPWMVDDGQRRAALQCFQGRPMASPGYTGSLWRSKLV